MIVNNLYIFLLILLFPFAVESQTNPIEIDFVEAQPIWEHETTDPDNPKTYGAIGRTALLIEKNENDLYVLSDCGSPHNGDSHGYIFEKLNCKTGELLWKDINNYYTGDIPDLITNVQLRPGGNVELLGSKFDGMLPDNPGLFEAWDFFVGGSNLMRKVYDSESGDIINEYVGIDSIGFPGRFLPQYAIEYDNKYLLIRQNGVFDEDGQPIGFSFNFFSIDANQNLIDPIAFDSIYYETQDSLDYFSITGQFYPIRISDDTFLGYIIQDRYNEEKYKFQLIWMKVIDNQSVELLNRKNIEHIIPISYEKLIYLHVEYSNDQIVITQLYYNSEIGDYTSYLLWLTKDGQVVSFIPVFSAENHVYKDTKFLYADEEHCYLLAFPSKTGRNGFDILKTDDTKDSVTYVSSLTCTNENEYFTDLMNVHELFEDNKLIIGAYNTRVDGDTSVLKTLNYYCFDTKDLGIDLVNTNDISKEENISVYPNPTKDFLFLEFNEDCNTEYEYSLYNSLGVLIMTGKTKSVKKYSINFKGLDRGIYFLHLKNKKENSTNITKIIFQ